MPEDVRLGLAAKPFFYTIDQISGLLELEEDYIKSKMLHFEGRSPGMCPRTKMLAVNVAPEGERPEWRISERSLIRYLRSRGIRFYERGYVK